MQKFESCFHIEGTYNQFAKRKKKRKKKIIEKVLKWMNTSWKIRLMIFYVYMRSLININIKFKIISRHHQK